MKVLLIDVDELKFNLALMHISSYHKSLEDQVFFRTMCDPDRVYISCIFSWNRSKALGIATMFPDAEVWIGGSGVNYSTLPDEIEHTMPDYALYGIDYSVGFTSRGCIRKCPWCVVPEKEGPIRNHAPLEEFLHPKHEKIVLLDNNFLASPNWEPNLEEICKRRLKISFNQGLDIRLVDEHNAEMLAGVLYYDGYFKKRRLYFAFDSPKIERQVFRGLSLLEDAGIKPDHLMFYVLIGYDTSYEEDLRRIKLLADRGIRPYVMSYNDRKDSYYHHLERWVNGRYYKVFAWKNYDSGDSQEVIAKYESLP